MPTKPLRALILVRVLTLCCRVVPLHSLKLISQLQYELASRDPDNSKQRNPLLIRVEVRAGHGAGKPTAKVIAETSDLIGFAAQCVGGKWTGAAVATS
jgi:prolyl oligopeptidase